MTENACLAIEPVDPSEHVRLPYSAEQPCEESVDRAGRLFERPSSKRDVYLCDLIDLLRGNQ